MYKYKTMDLKLIISVEKAYIYTYKYLSILRAEENQLDMGKIFHNKLFWHKFSAQHHG